MIPIVQIGKPRHSNLSVYMMEQEFTEAICRYLNVSWSNLTSSCFLFSCPWITGVCLLKTHSGYFIAAINSIIYSLGSRKTKASQSDDMKLEWTLRIIHSYMQKQYPMWNVDKAIYLSIRGWDLKIKGTLISLYFLMKHTLIECLDSMTRQSFISFFPAYLALIL